MSAPRGKSLNKLNVSGGIKNLQVKDEIAHIPPTLYKFPSNKSASGFPMLPSRQNVNDVSISLGPQIREASADTFTPKAYLSEMLKPDIFSKSMKANKILKSDKEHSKIDFSKKANDVSYLMETRTYMKEQKLNDHSANLVKRSLDLLSPKHQVNFGEYSILASPQYREEKPGSRKEKANIYLEMKEYGKEEPALSEALTKFKLPYQAEESPERKPNVNRSIDMENGNGSFSRTLPKIVDSSKLGSTIDLPDSPNRDELKDTFMMRMRKGTIVQKRSQNKNLTVPSGRKEVVSLSDWLANMLEDVQRNKFLGLPEILDQTQLVYTVCLEEIIRQVKIQCSERGQILEKIWEAYMNLFNRAMDISYKEKKHLENLHNEEMSRIKFLYEKDIEHQLHKIKETQEELDKQNALLEKEIERRTFLESKTERLTKDVFSLKHELHKAQTEMQSLINNPKYEADVNAKKNLTSIQLHKQSKSKKNTSQGKAFSNEASFTEEDSLQEQSSQSNLEEKTEDLRDEQQPFEERWKEAETDTNDLDKFIDNNQLIQKEMLDKSVQYDNENNDEDENEEIEDTDKIKEEGSSDEESEEDIQAVHSAQEMIEVQNLEEMQTVKEALDQLAVVELYELEKEIQSRIAQFEEPGESKKRHKKTRSVSFAKEKALKKSSLKKKKNKGEQIASENSSVVVDKGTTKEDVIEVLEKYQENQLYPSLKDIPTEDQMIEFMLQFLKGDEKWKMQDFQYLVKKITKRKAHSLDLDQEISKEDIGTSSKLKSLNGDQLSQTIKSMEKEDLVGIIAELERKLEEIIKGNEQGANNQEIVEMLKIIFEEREELMDGKYRPLFKKILQAYEQSANQNMELKIQNKEQDVDLKEFENEREKQENRTRDLYRQINDWQEKNQDLQKMNKKLQKTLVRQKTFTKEINSKKIEKLGSLINGYISGPGIDSKDSRDEYDDTTERERTNPIKEPSVENTSTEEQSPLKAVTMNIIDNIAEIMKMPGSDLEEEWSESDDNTGKSEKNYDKEERKNIQRSSSRTLSVFASRKNRNTVILTRPIDGLKSKRIVRVTNINGESANALLAKAKQKKNIKSALTKPSLLKFMSQFYIEKIKDIKKSPQTPLHVSVYEYFMNKYGLKKVAETKCLQIYEAAIAFAGTKKIHRFRELLGLGESFEVVEELDLYLSTFRQLDISGNGVSIASNTQEKIFIGLDQAEAATIGLFEKKLDTQSLKESLASLYKLNSVDRASRLVELEDVVDKFIYIQRNLQDTVKGFVKEIFGATDLDNDETIEFFEFNILYKHVEKERYDKNQVKDMFFEHADLILSDGSNEPVLSFNKFAWICLEMKLFSEERQKLFARVPNSADRVQTVHDLEQGLKEKLNEIRLRFMKSQTYTSQVKNIMMKLFSSVRNPQKSRNVVWLSYRLLDEESKSQLLDYEIRMMLPDEFRIIQKFVDEMEGWDDNNY